MSLLIGELHSKSKHGHAGIAVGEPLAIALFDVNKALRHIDLAPRSMAFHTAACAGAPGGTCLQLLAMPGYAVACQRGM